MCSSQSGGTEIDGASFRAECGQSRRTVVVVEDEDAAPCIDLLPRRSLQAGSYPTRALRLRRCSGISWSIVTSLRLAGVTGTNGKTTTDAPGACDPGGGGEPCGSHRHDRV